MPRSRTEKYDATVASMIGLLKYGSGLPYNRLQGLQRTLEVPLPASTQWEIVSGPALAMRPVWDELIRQAAQGDVLYNDDTTVKILERMGPRAKQAALAESEEKDDGRPDASGRKALFTSGGGLDARGPADRIVLQRPPARQRELASGVAPSRGGPGTADSDVRCALGAAALSIVGYHHDRTHPVIRLWNDCSHEGE